MIHRSTYTAIFTLLFVAVILYLMRNGHEPMRTIVGIVAGLLAGDAIIFFIRQLFGKKKSTE